MKAHIMSNYDKLINATKPHNIVPVIVINDIEHALPMAEAFMNTDICVLEVTLRTSIGAQAIALIKENFPHMMIGAGTVTNHESLEIALSAGSDFIVSPGTTSALFAAFQKLNIPVFPGVSTVSEAMTAYQKGFKYQKFFPAESVGGAPALKRIYDPLPEIRFMPTGGIGPANVRDYLALENVICVGGSWMMDTTSMHDADWKNFEQELKQRIKF